LTNFICKSLLFSFVLLTLVLAIVRVSDGASSPVRANSGTSVQHSVDILWNASASPNIRGYNLYRSSVSGGPYSLIRRTGSMVFTDSYVTPGVTYFYVVTAVGTDGMESSFSNEVRAQIPIP
jgi:fibronectin type 3 domain-containing protein